MDVHREGEIVSNTETTHLERTARTDNHGTRMASIIAASANDNAGITGVMWGARLRLVEAAAFTPAGQPMLNANGRRFNTDASLFAALNAIMLGGPRVVNISLGDESNTAITQPHNAAQDRQRATYGRLFADLNANWVQPGARRPLWVISAGNMRNATDVYWNALTGAADGLPDEVLIVTGARAQLGQLLPAATGSGAIDIAAPGENVAVSDSSGVSAVSGASPATALVTGAAGLLFAFDDTITAAQARRLLIDGALASGRMAGAYPILDAYESLRLAARRPGAPLCGNRVWLDDVGNIRVERDATATNGDVLFTPSGGDWQNSYPNVYHGGRRIDLSWGREFRYSVPSRSWFEMPVYTGPGPGERLGGAFKSSNFLEDHDGRRGIQGRISGVGASTVLTLTVYDAASNRSVLRTISFSTPQGQGVDTCVKKEATLDATGHFIGYETCVARAEEGSWTEIDGVLQNMNGAIAPKGDFALILLNYHTYQVLFDPAFTTCPGSSPGVQYPDQCRLALSSTSSSAYYQIVRFDLDNGTAQLLPVAPSGATSVPDRSVPWISISERGDEAVIQVGRFARNPQYSCANSATQFVALPGASSAAGTVGRTVPLDNVRFCEGVFDVSGTFAPLRAPDR